MAIFAFLFGRSAVISTRRQNLLNKTKDERDKLSRSLDKIEKSKTRCVKLEITSFRGISWGAIHYYGKLVADGIDFQCLDNPRITTSNRNAKKISPFYQWRYEFELRRPVTQEEINHDPDRWECYQLGTFTTSFDTKEEIIALAKECFKMRFTGEWELWVDDCTMARTTVYQVEL